MSHAKIVTPLLGMAALEQRQLPVRLKRVAAKSADLRNRFERPAIFDRHVLATGADMDGGAYEMDSRHLANPGVLDSVQRDRHPGVFLIMGIACIELGHAAEVLNSNLVEAAGPVIEVNLARCQ